MTVPYAVVVHLRGPGIRIAPLLRLQKRLAARARRTATGVCDGNEFALDGTEARLYFEGPDAGRLRAALSPILDTARLCRGARVEEHK